MNGMTLWDSLKPPIMRVIGGLWTYVRSKPLVRCPMAYLISVETDFFPDRFGDFEEVIILDISLRLYNEGYVTTGIADAYVEALSQKRFLFLRRYVAVENFQQMTSSDKPQDRLIGISLPPMTLPENGFRCRFAADSSKEYWEASSAHRLKHRLVIIPMRQSPIRLFLRESSN